jgi:hypothetical protein
VTLAPWYDVPRVIDHPRREIMSEDISGQITTGILNAFAILGGGILFLWYWEIIVPLTIIGLVVWVLYKLARA